ncbi:uncharacterized protein At3g17950-like [Primulina eburnea]|uniref:uncharacterized protein At3g17950-like n=1 Tax=Primulina eburnea TaxID=1245227 RepID=UPI003C6C1305
MLDPANDMVPPPSSPSASSLSSSDLDTESTGSFFHDGSTTLGTLMGVTLQAITFRAASQRENSLSAVTVGRRSRKPEKFRGGVVTRKRRRWWMLCGEEGDAARRASLGEYLEVERRFGESSSVAVELEEGIVLGQPRNGRALFAEGRVLPPAEVVEESPPTPPSGVCRFSALVAVDRWCSLCSVS